MNEFSKYVGLDVHKETIAVSVAEANGGELRYVGESRRADRSLGARWRFSQLWSAKLSDFSG